MFDDFTVKFIQEKHRFQERKYSLAPYYTHPLAVGYLVMKYKKSHKIDVIYKAALLHDTIEDTDTTEEEIDTAFGWHVLSLVQELTSDKKEIKRIGKTAYLSNKMVNMSSYALVIKLCDRLHNCMDFIFADKKFIDKYIKETEDILEYLETNRELSGTHKAIIVDIRRYLELGKVF